MTIQEIDRMVRQANPVPDLRALDPVGLSDLKFSEQRSLDMQTQDRIEQEQGTKTSRRGILIAAAAGVLVLLGGFAVAYQGRAPVQTVSQQPVNDVATTLIDADASRLATSLLTAYAAFDVDQVASYLADGARVDLFAPDWRRGARWLQSTGFKVLVGTCEAGDTTAAGTSVHCPFDYHGLRSDEMGLGPFAGNSFDVTVDSGEVVSVSMSLEYTTNGFSTQMWEPFAQWISDAYPADVASMYVGGDLSQERHDDEAVQLWEQRTKEYVADPGLGPENVAAGFLEAYAALDVGQIDSYVADGSRVSMFAPGQIPWLEATGFEIIPGICKAGDTTAAGTPVHCPYDYHGLRSDEMGLGPFTDNWVDVTVRDGEVVSTSINFETASNGFSAQVWEPFAQWIADTYPADAASMYEGGNFGQELYTDEAVQLWEQHTKEYVIVQTTP